MTYHGWLWTGSTWRHVCTAESIPACAKLLDQLHPGINNTYLAITRGQVPSWQPGQMEWEKVEP